MLIEVKVPVLPESITEATLVNWHKKAGDAVKRDENLVDVETDKVVLELPAPGSGVVTEIRKPDGATVTAQEVIAVIDTDAKGAAPGDVAAAARAPAPAPVQAPAVKLPAALGDRPEQRVPMSRLRQRVAERLVQSQSTAAILTTFNEANMAPVIDLRNRYKDRFEKEHGVKLGFMGFFVKAAVHALKKFPVVNASIDGTDIVYHGYFDIGIAVGSPRGLVVPIIRDADRMSFAEIEKTIGEFGKRAQDGKLTLEEPIGGTFSIADRRGFGSMPPTPVIHAPQFAILGDRATQG